MVEKDNKKIKKPLYEGLWGNPDDLDPELKKELRLERYRKYLAELKIRLKI